MPALDEAETAPKLCVQDSTAMTLKRKHGDVQLGTVPVAGSKQAAAEHTRHEQFWRSISSQWIDFLRTRRGQDIDFEDFVSWVNDRAFAAGLQNPWAQLVT